MEPVSGVCLSWYRTIQIHFQTLQKPEFNICSLSDRKCLPDVITDIVSLSSSDKEKVENWHEL